MAALFALLVVVGALAFSLMPLFRPEEQHADGLADDLAADRDRVLAALRDADLDLAMGKISAEDHAEMRGALEERAMRVLSQIDRDAPPNGGA